MDRRLLRFFRTAGHTVVGIFSRSGEHAAIWMLLGTTGMALDGSRRTSWFRATFVTGFAYLLNIAIKFVVRRRRPQLIDLPPLASTVTQLSFPSAHSTSSFAAARAFSQLVPAAPLYLMACAMALSRLYLGLHYPSDIAAGATLGTLVGRLARSKKEMAS